MARRDRLEEVKEIVKILHKRFPDARCLLDYKNPFQLLISTILAAQCTDARVNLVAKDLYRKYRKPEDFIKVTDKELEQDILTTGFYRNKTKSVKKCCRSLMERHNGNVPETMDELVKLGGVGRKTANVILVNCFNQQGIIVDTHMLRVAQRIGLTKNKDANKVEQDLMKLVPDGKWSLFSHVISFHGRNICAARNPDCAHCPMNKYCDYGQMVPGKR